MSTSDILKAALEKKRQQNQKVGKTKTKGADKGSHSNQITTNKPQKRAAGRGG
jgi:hypothetical protein